MAQRKIEAFSVGGGNLVPFRLACKKERLNPYAPPAEIFPLVPIERAIGVVFLDLNRVIHLVIVVVVQDAPNEALPAVAGDLEPARNTGAEIGNEVVAGFIFALR
jgi:hypothetical protein